MKQANKQLLIVLVLVFVNILICILFFSKIPFQIGDCIFTKHNGYFTDKSMLMLCFI